MNCSSIPDYTHTLDLVVALGGIPSAFFFLFPTDYPVNYQSAKSKVMNNKKKNEGQTDFSYYGLYLLDYLRTNKFEQASFSGIGCEVCGWDTCIKYRIVFGA